MHVFQPCPLELLEVNPFTKFSSEWALVTAGNKKKANTMTISWGGMGVIWGKNVVYVFIRDSRYTKELIDQGDFFSISFFDEEYRDALHYCGSHSGKDEDKIKNAGLNVGFLHGIPYIDEANMLLLCNKLFATRIEKDSILAKELVDKFYPDDDLHTMYIAEVIEILAR